jgi:hypothetical protein
MRRIASWWSPEANAVQLRVVSKNLVRSMTQNRSRSNDPEKDVTFTEN